MKISENSLKNENLILEKVNLKSQRRMIINNILKSRLLTHIVVLRNVSCKNNLKFNLIF